MDKDNDAPTDDYIGKFETTIQPGAKQVKIEGPVVKHTRGDFFLKVNTCSLYAQSVSLTLR
jgi:hypothetical protein